MRGPPGFFSHRKGADFLRNPTPSSVLGLIWNTKNFFYLDNEGARSVCTKEYIANALSDWDGDKCEWLCRRGRPESRRDVKKSKLLQHMCMVSAYVGTWGKKFCSARGLFYGYMFHMDRYIAIVYSSINIYCEGDLFKKRPGFFLKDTNFSHASHKIFFTVVVNVPHANIT